MLNPRNIPLGTIIGDYQIESYIGCGNNAAVYRAEQRSLKRTVALKVLFLTTDNDDENFIELFINEVRSAAALSHTNLIKAIEVGIFENVYFFAMEYVDGKSLQKLLNDDELPDLPLIIKIMAEIASGLSYGLEKQRLTHGDIKPDNILLSSNNVPKLADFGLAKTRGNSHEKRDEIIVTPLYASPESVQGKAKNGDPLPDIYSFGCTLFHLITNRTVFIGDDANEICQRQAFEMPPRIEELEPNLPPDLINLVNSMLKKDPTKRPQSWNEISKRLFSLLDGYSDYKSKVKKFKNTVKKKRNKRVKNGGNSPVLFVSLLLALTFSGVGLYKIKDIRSYFAYKKIVDNSENTRATTMVNRLNTYIKIYGDAAKPEAYKLLKRYERTVEKDKKENE